MTRKAGFGAVLLIVAVWSVTLYFVSPEHIVARLGANNTFLAVFVAGILGGTSIVFPFPYYLVVATAAAGGANPFLVGLCAALGVMVGMALISAIAAGASTRARYVRPQYHPP